MSLLLMLNILKPEEQLTTEYVSLPVGQVEVSEINQTTVGH